ncbi:hypothetical protein WOLCODRAFT_28882 [Wolfiporia cocos MD-104 SS10]|uniref:Uncharacterized protein n=1 Tax=Wolfiporia cocos (strain MD-104) TaxID=742152 RepID=A0A2H3J436_WOLCO|nr:hypothetical protein WOLCODRAFT_28882 [Wolfiporia cocos MD-104 SS10]
MCVGTPDESTVMPMGPPMPTSACIIPPDGVRRSAVMFTFIDGIPMSGSVPYPGCGLADGDKYGDAHALLPALLQPATPPIPGHSREPKDARRI